MPVTALDFTLPYASSRSPVMGRNMVAASQPLAAQAGLQMLLKGGNAIDAAIATAMALTVVEPTGCGLGSDAFAIVWDGGKLHGLNSSGRSPASWARERFGAREVMPEHGWEAVTVPGAVAAWVELARRFGTLPLPVLAGPAITYARHGFPVSPKIAGLWELGGGLLARQPGFAEHFLPGGRAPRPGEIFKCPAIADSLELIADTAGEAFYLGALADGMAAHARAHGGALDGGDLAAHTADWVDLVGISFGQYRLQELPPNGQGIAALMAAGMMEALGTSAGGPDDPKTIHAAIEAIKLAFADVHRYVADPASMAVPAAALLDPAYLAARAKLIDPKSAGVPSFGTPKDGGTVYLAAADASGRMISYIQSNYMGFGSGIVAPGGISMQNRGAGFVLDPGHANEVGPRKRPFHTIIPGFVTEASGAPFMAYGVMGASCRRRGICKWPCACSAMGRTRKPRPMPRAGACCPGGRLPLSLRSGRQRSSCCAHAGTRF